MTPRALKRLVFVFEFTTLGVVMDWGAYHPLEEHAHLLVPAFNYAIAWIIRFLLVFAVVTYSSMWVAAVGTSSVARRVVPQALLVITLVLPDAAALGHLPALSAVGVGSWIAVGLALVLYRWPVAAQVPSVFPELDDGSALSEHYDHSPLLTRVLLPIYPPTRRSHLLVLDILLALGVWYVLTGNWFVVE